MYKVERTTKQFHLEDEKAMKEYNTILSNPLCSVINSWKEKKISSEYDEGRLTSTVTDLVLVVTWEEKSII